MKLTASTFIFCICFYLLQPFLLQLTHLEQKHKYCTKCHVIESKSQPVSDNSKSDGCCPNGACHPFETCGCCLFITNDAPITQSTDKPVLTKLITSLDAQLISMPSAKCWKPPKIV